MKISRAGIDLIKKWEGCRLNAYLDQAGIPTIGWGTTTAAGFGDIHIGMKIDQEQADEWLVAGLPQYELIVQRALKRVPTQSQFDALVCLCYNVPKAFPDSTVVREFNAGNFSAAADGFLLWNKVRKNGVLVPSPGLMNRRMDERKLFMSVAKSEPAVLIDFETATEKDMNMTINAPALSKINWTNVIAAIATLVALFGINMTPELQVQIIAGIGLVSQVLSVFFRTFMTQK